MSDLRRDTLILQTSLGKDCNSSCIPEPYSPLPYNEFLNLLFQVAKNGGYSGAIEDLEEDFALALEDLTFL